MQLSSQQTTSSQPPSNQGGPTTLPAMLYLYTLVFHLLLVAALFLLYGSQDHSSGAFTTVRLWPTSWTEPLTIGTYVSALMAWLMAQTLPRALTAKRRRTQERSHPTGPSLLPYLVRLALLEIITLAGFILAMFKEDPYLAIPLAAAGFMATLFTVPTARYLQRLGGPPA